MNPHGFLRITTATLATHIANPEANAREIISLVDQHADSDIVLFPELCLPGYTCADLFAQSRLLAAGEAALSKIAAITAGRQQLVVVGVPVAVGNCLYNCGAVISEGRLLGVVPKQFIPNYREFYESRWFTGASGAEPQQIELCGQSVPFGIDLLFASGSAVIGIEICEDLWMPIPPSSFQAVAGANVLLNLSASNETVGKSRYRRDLVAGQSGRCISAYAYASAGPTESTTDLVFGGHCLIAENGVVLTESRRVGDGQPVCRDSLAVTADVDLERLQNDRRQTTSFHETGRRAPIAYRRIACGLSQDMAGLRRKIDGTPFVPRAGAELHARCAEIFGIQQAGLAQRLSRLPGDLPLNIGVSGGLDSTLALLVAVTTCDLLGASRERIHGLTMPGFGTTQRTRTNALALMQRLGVKSDNYDIRPLCLDAFRALGHRPFGIDCSNIGVDDLQQRLAEVPAENRHDLVFENVQARIRTFLLMSRGFVIGTGDLSEAALGWSTYNGDHMSMYNPNCSIPKTLVKFLVEYAAREQFTGEVSEILLSIAGTTISPELLPASQTGEIVQSTEETLGAYELHDFILFHVVRNGFGPEKIRYLAGHAEFTRPHTADDVDRALQTFYRRFFANQFKRSCVPDGPKVGTVSLSPRGDWRMPSDADADLWLNG